MSRYLFEQSKTHPLLEQLRAEGERPTIHAHERAVWIPLCRDPGGSKGLVEARVEGEWWRPTTQAHGNELLDELVEQAVRLRAEFLSRQPID